MDLPLTVFLRFASDRFKEHTIFANNNDTMIPPPVLLEDKPRSLSPPPLIDYDNYGAPYALRRQKAVYPPYNSYLNWTFPTSNGLKIVSHATYSDDILSAEYRLSTFANRWSNTIISTKDLAEAGFCYYCQDECVCVFCHKKLHINMLRRDTSAMEIHLKLNSICPFILGKNIGNIPLPVQSSSTNADKNPNPTSTQKSVMSANTVYHIDNHQYADLEISTTMMVIPRHNPRRLISSLLNHNTIKRVEQTLPQNEKEYIIIALRKNLFGCANIMDECITDKVAECRIREAISFVRADQELTHMLNILQQSPKENNDDDPPLEPPMQPFSSDYSCCICIENSANVIFVNCYHVSVCENCVKFINTCPICRSPITSHMTLTNIIES